MNKKIICWRGTDGDLSPVKCFCDKFGYPNKCTDIENNEETMFENTHFLSENDAWKSIIVSVKAGVSLSGSTIKTLTAELEKAKDEAALAAKEYHIVKYDINNPFSDQM